jgi:hypothetical protein
VDAPPAIELVWDRGHGADSCIEGAELAGRVQATLGRPVRSVRGGTHDENEPGAANDSRRVAIGSEMLEGSVSPLPAGGWIAVVIVRGIDGAVLRREVTLAAADCRQLDEAIVLVVALMADAPSPRPPALVVRTRRDSTSIAIGPDVALAVGMLPGLALGFGFSSDVAIPPHWHVAAWAHAWPVSEVLDDGSGARLAAWTFGAGPCLGTASGERWSIFGCLGAAAGVVYASGVGLEVSHSRALAYVQGELRVGIRGRLWGPLFLRLEGGAAVPATRATYEFTAADGLARDVFRTAAVVPVARLGVEFRAP